MNTIEFGEKRLFSSLIDCSITTGGLSHAYLLDVGSSCNFMDDVLLAVKKILCPFCCFAKCDKSNCNICSLIDKNEYSELKIIEPVLKGIKKEEIIKLQNDFSMKALSGKRRVYIIKEADKMNNYSANSLLKFLEEPNDGVVAILISSNVNLLLPTIVSRCQVIKLFSLDKNILNEEIFKKVYPFVLSLEKDGILTILVEKELWTNKFVNSQESEEAIDTIILFYSELLRYLIVNDLKFFGNYMEWVKEISFLNTISSVCFKIKKLIEIKDLLKYNLNSSLYLDKLIIEFGGVKDGFSWCTI